MAWELPAPKDNTALLEAALQRRLQLLQQPTAMQQLAPQIAKATGDIAEGAVQGIHQHSVQAAHELIGDYLGLDEETKNLPGVKSKYIQALQTAGFQPPETKEKPQVPMSVEVSKKLAEQAGIPLPPRGYFFESEAPSIKLATPKPVAVSVNALSKAQNAALQKALDDKLINQSVLNMRPQALGILADQFLKRPDYQALGVNLDYKEESAKRTATGKVKGGKGFETTASVGTLDDVIKMAEPLITKLSPSSIRAVNAAWRSGLNQVKDDPEATQLLTHMSEIQGLYAQVLRGQGTPTDQADKRAGEVVGQAFGPGGFAGMKKAVLMAGKSRAGRLSGSIPTPAPTSIEDNKPVADPLGLFK